MIPSPIKRRRLDFPVAFDANYTRASNTTTLPVVASHQEQGANGELSEPKKWVVLEYFPNGTNRTKTFDNEHDALMHEAALEFRQLKPVSYHLKRDVESKQLYYGFIAQELNEIYPNVVQYTAEDRLGIICSRLVYVFVIMQSWSVSVPPVVVCPCPSRPMITVVISSIHENHGNQQVFATTTSLRF